MRAEVVVSGLAMAGIGVVVAEPIAVFAGQRLVREHFVEYAHYRRVVEQNLRWAAVIVALVRRQGLALVEKPMLVGANRRQLFFAQQRGQEDKSLEVEKVLLGLGHRDDGSPVGIGRGQQFHKGFSPSS